MNRILLTAMYLSFGTTAISSPIYISIQDTTSSNQIQPMLLPLEDSIRLDSSVTISLCDSTIGEIRQDTISCLIPEEPTYLMAEEMPRFHGDNPSQFWIWLQQNLIYPQLALENGIEGSVVVSFIVETSGELSNIEIQRSVHPVLDEAAIAVIRKSPAWIPGTIDGQKVRVKFSIPVIFRYQ